MSLLIANLLGQPQLCVGTRPCKFKVRKAEALLYYCLLSPRPMPTLHLCDLLWLEVEEKKARQNLNDAFYSLRSGLQEADAPPVIVNCLSRTREGQVEFNRHCSYACDVEAFENIIANVTEQTDLSTLEKALELYRGVFLENFVIHETPGFDAWAEGKRQTLAGAYRKLLHLLSTCYLTRSHWQDAIKCLECLRLDLVDAQASGASGDQEVVYGLLMTCHALTYRLDLAEKAYEAYVQRQEAELAAAIPAHSL